MYFTCLRVTKLVTFAYYGTSCLFVFTYLVNTSHLKPPLENRIKLYPNENKFFYVNDLSAIQVQHVFFSVFEIKKINTKTTMIKVSLKFIQHSIVPLAKAEESQHDLKIYDNLGSNAHRMIGDFVH